MKQYVVDQIRPQDYESIRERLEARFGKPRLDSIYWIELPHGQLTDTQKSHSDCSPFYFAAELENDRLSCELLVRSSVILRCDCIGYATADQRNWLIAEIDAMLQELGISL
jgi:hypothetical protein